jgi:hypothetical protein
VAVALLLGRSGIFPWRWASTTPEVATLLTTLVVSDQVAAVALYVVLACVLVPLLTELFFRYGAIEWLRSRGLSAPTAVAVAAVAYGATFLSGLSANSDAALRHAGFGVLFGLVLGLLAVKGRRGRGLGLAIIAHGAFVAVELAVLLGVRVTP